MRPSSFASPRLLALVLALAAGCGPAAAAETVRIACSGLGQELELCRSESAQWARETGNAVEVVPMPADATQQLQQFDAGLVKGSQLDVIQVDVAQVGLLAGRLLDLTPYAHGAEKLDFPGMLSNSLVRGRLMAMPWFIDGGLLYYRKDLLNRYHQPVPRTWADLRAIAGTVQAGERAAGNGRMWGYVWQGRAYEGLTCDGLELMAAYGAGTIVDPAGNVTVGNPATVKAFSMLAGFVGTISPPAVLDYSESESLAQFMAGNAVFMRNWPYAWAASQAARSAVRDKVGVAALPMGDGPAARHAAALGGQELAVSKFSSHPALAASLVMYLTGEDVQRRRAIRASFNPTIRGLYLDSEVLIANPFTSSLQQVFANAVARPTSITGAKYGEVSAAFYQSLHDVLAHADTPESAVLKLNVRLTQLQNAGGW
ncbi:MAG TPA: ABC transporter substrate-binding protein [Burkholderiaceae bacterium]